MSSYSFDNSNKYRRRSLPVIQIAPLIDVCLVLLIVFMCVAPAAISGIDVSLPQGGDVSNITSSSSQSPITITYTKNNKIYVDDIPVRLGNVLREIDLQTDNRKSTVVFIKSDKSNSYGDVLSLLSKINRGGYNNAILVMEPIG